MSKIFDELNRQKERLFEKHPDLRRLRVIPLSQTGMSFEEISDFIEEVWRDYYGDAARIFYTPQLIEWLLPNFENDKTSLAVIDPLTSEPAALFLSFDRVLSLRNGRQIKAAIRSGLSVHPQRKGKRLGSLLTIENMINYLTLGYDLCADWYDIRESGKGGAIRISQNIWGGGDLAGITVSGKTLNLDTAQKYQSLNSIERTVIRLNSLVNPITLKPDLPYVSQSIQDIAEVLAFYDRCTLNRPLRRHFAEKELLRQLTYHKDGFVFLLKDSGGIKALVNGYNNRISERDAVAYLDMVLFDSHLSFSKKRNFMRHVESKIYDDHGAFAIVLFASGINENMLKYGYIPFEKQAVAIFPLKEGIAIEPDALKGIFLDVK